MQKAMAACHASYVVTTRSCASEREGKGRGKGEGERRGLARPGRGEIGGLERHLDARVDAR